MVQSAQFEWRGAQAQAQARTGAVEGLTVASEYLLSVSQPLVPHEEGELERSGRADVDESNLVGGVGYDTEYAVRQHEEIGWNHPLKGQAKYLEEPFLAEQDQMQQLIAASIRRSLR